MPTLVKTGGAALLCVLPMLSCPCCMQTHTHLVACHQLQRAADDLLLWLACEGLTGSRSISSSSSNSLSDFKSGCQTLTEMSSSNSEKSFSSLSSQTSLSSSPKPSELRCFAELHRQTYLFVVFRHQFAGGIECEKIPSVLQEPQMCRRVWSVNSLKMRYFTVYVLHTNSESSQRWTAPLG